MGQNYINAGTASITNGDKTITFSGVSLSLIKAGDLFTQGLASGVIESVEVDAGTASLVTAWAGSTTSGLPYEVLVIPQASELAQNTRTLMAALAGVALGSFIALAPAAGDTIGWDVDTGWNAASLADLIGSIDASVNPISNITTAMFAANVVDIDPTLAANSDSRIASQKAVLSLVSNAITGITWKAAAAAATTGALPAYTYANGTSGVGATLTGSSNGALAAQDGVTLTAGRRLLVKNQTSTNAPHNGVYILTQVGDSTHPYILTRATDTDTGAELWGAAVFVEAGGTANGATQWVNSNSAQPTIGTTGITFGQIAGAGTYSAGSGLSLAGNQFSVASGGISSTMLASSLSLTTPSLGVATGTSLALGGATLGSNALAVTGTALFSGLIGIGMTPVNVLDITKNQNANSIIALLNNNTGSSAAAYFDASNGTSEFRAGILSTTAGAGAVPNAGGFIYSTTAITLDTGGFINFAAGGGGEQMRLTTSGKLVVGATAPWAGAMIEGVAGDGGFGISGYAASTSGQAVLSRVDSTASYLFGMYYSTGIVAYYTTNGSTATFNNPSDARFKNVRAEQANFRTALQQLWVGEFDWKDSEKAYGFGLLAQQMYDVLPTSAKDFFVAKPDNDSDKWFLKESHLSYLALWGVNDLYSMAETQEQKIVRLEARVDELEREAA